MSPASDSPTTRLALDEDDAGAGDRRDPMLPKRGHLLAGKYRIDVVLGRGGMGVVVAGHQLSLDRPVAIKFLSHTLADNSRQRFTREAMATARLHSPHVVRVHDAGEEDGVPFIVMERLVGSDLAAELERAPLEPAVAVRYLREACDAIAEAHAHGIIHRDIKPSNLFLAQGTDGRRTLKVLDFGVSKWLVSAPDGETPLSTSDQGLLGTPAYVAPEQLTKPGAVDARADVWALGVVLYQCLSGKRPFQARGVPQLCAAILTAPPAPIDPALGVPEALRAIVERCLRKQPDERYPSVAKLGEALASLAVAERAGGLARPGRARSVLVAGLLLGALVVLALWLTDRFRAQPEPAASRLEASPLALPTVPKGSASAPTSEAAEGPPNSAPSALPAPPSRARHAANAGRSSLKPMPSSAASGSAAPSGERSPEPPRDVDSKPMYRL